MKAERLCRPVWTTTHRRGQRRCGSYGDHVHVQLGELGQGASPPGHRRAGDRASHWADLELRIPTTTRHRAASNTSGATTSQVVELVDQTTSPPLPLRSGVRLFRAPSAPAIGRRSLPAGPEPCPARPIRRRRPEHEAAAARARRADAASVHHRSSPTCAASALHLLKGELGGSAAPGASAGSRWCGAGTCRPSSCRARESPASAWALAQRGEASEALESPPGSPEPLLEAAEAAQGVVFGMRGWAVRRRSVDASSAARSGSTRRGAWAIERIGMSPAAPRIRGHALHLLGDIATHPRSVRCRERRGALPARHWPSPSRAACARSSRTATSAFGKLYRAHRVALPAGAGALVDHRR